MRREILDTTRQPVTGWHITDYDTGFLVTANDYDGLFRNWRNHREANRLVVDMKIMKQMVHDYYCSNKIVTCKRIEEYNLKDKRKRKAKSVETFIEGTKAVLEITKHVVKEGKAPFVGPIEANRRAEICSTWNNGKKCPKNENIKRAIKAGCGGCAVEKFMDFLNDTGRKLLSLFGAAAAPYKIARAKELNVCTACNCDLKTKVKMSEESIRRLTTEAHMTEYPEQCWVKQLMQKVQVKQEDVGGKEKHD